MNVRTKTKIIKAQSRGKVNLGWLDSKHSFSFGHWYDPDRIQFGALRVLNDDIISGGSGFGTHPHQNMEIISIPLYGGLEHKDSTGTAQTLMPGEVQVMSAGTGVTHSEYNHKKDEDTNFLQIWILPRQQNEKPRYDQKDIPLENGKFSTLVTPDDAQEEGSVWIRQDAWISRLQNDASNTIKYHKKSDTSGVFFFVVEGEINVHDGSKEHRLSKRDALEISNSSDLDIESLQGPIDVLAIEVPLS
jgi:redox-sensitive bicupin YhaK (pirin superfamily)